MIAAAVDRGPHESVMEPDVMRQFQAKNQEKMKRGQAKLVAWDIIKDNPPEELKVSPLAAIPHMSRGWRAILDVAFSLHLTLGGIILSVNESSNKTATRGSINQLGHVLMRTTYVLAVASNK